MFELDLTMIGFGRARRVLYRDYDPRIAAQEFDGDGYEVDVDPYLPDKKLTSPILNKRSSIFRRSPKARTFVVLAPEGDPGRDKPMLFVDIDLVGPSLREALGDDM
jgi:hypothetical protein